jgi:hypothetical protein
MRMCFHEYSKYAYTLLIFQLCHYYSSSTRVYLRKGRGEERVAKLFDSPDMPESEASYAINSGGIIDIDF